MTQTTLTPHQPVTTITLTPVQSASLTPVDAADQPFARMRHAYGDFQAVKDAFATFAELKAS